MRRQEIAPERLVLPVVSAWADRWFLLVAGDRKAFNCMTVAWGSMGVMWSKPFVMAVVRPSRHTYGFMEDAASFTLCAFPAAFKDKLTFCGSHSGRDTDKVRECGFTVRPSARVEAPGFDEAELIVECRKMYFQDLDPSHFLDGEIEGNYKGRDYHRMYFGQILAVQGSAAYRRGSD